MYKDKRVSAVIPVAGIGSRMGADKKKQFLEIYKIPIIIHTLKKISASEVVDEVIVVTGSDDVFSLENLVNEYRVEKIKEILPGGETRQASVYNGVMASTGDFILIHDGVRPLVTSEEIIETVYAAYEFGAAACGIPLTDTIKLSDEEGFSIKTLPRENIIRIQTPQVIERELYFSAYDNALKNSLDMTDDISLVELMGKKAKITSGSPENIKITRPGDIELAKKLMKGELQ